MDRRKWKNGNEKGGDGGDGGDGGGGMLMIMMMMIIMMMMMMSRRRRRRCRLRAEKVKEVVFELASRGGRKRMSRSK